ncbi:MAG: 3-keto-5-aminohexanoate cleavage protein [Candidatus Wallbacteria bacterium]|nr:3-keto-5-aminohexanoate cleavage protein [Candidatus Wallbacteria bacterium]
MKTIITVAVTGAETTKEQQPNLPVTPAEIAESAYQACLAGAAIVHLHVRKDDGTPTQDPAVFGEAIRLIRKKCDMLIEVTTGGAIGMSDDERIAPVDLGPELASLDCGSVNFGDEILPNSFPSLRRFAERMRKFGVKPTIECFDFGHINNAKILIKEGLITPPYYFTFVMGVPGGIPATVKNLLFMRDELPEGSHWSSIGIGGKASLPMGISALVSGGHVRTGFEDNVYYRKGELAESNAQLVKRIVSIAQELGHEIATPAEARAMLSIPKR